MFAKLEDVERRFRWLEDTLMKPDLSPDELMQWTKERSEIEPVVEAYRDYKAVCSDRDTAQEMCEEEDPDSRAFGQEELARTQTRIAELEEHLTLLMLPKDPRDGRNVLLEVRAGTGGEEAGIFAGDLVRMYTRYAESQRWRTTVLSATESAKGGYKEIVMLVEGERVYSRLKFEMGVHRVQRIPLTESQGRVHTSACTVAVLPEAEDVEVDIQPQDLRIDTYRSSGAGGQHVNTTDSAVRITHLPTGVVAECQDERSQHKNKDKAMKMLRSRILEQAQATQDQAISADRKAQVGTGDRSERIRTYNFPQGRITDHRINLTLYKLEDVVNGDLDEVLDALGTHHTAELLRSQG